MAISGVFTSLGVSKTIDAANNEGFYIKPLEFGVSETPGSIDPSRTGPNGGLYFQGAISSRVVVDQNTVKFVCTIPTGQTAGIKNIKEIYLFAEDSGAVEFMLALGAPDENLIYDPSGEVTLELQVSLVDVDLTAQYLFTNTIATELGEHNTSPNSHPELMELLDKHGIQLLAGAYPQVRKGQHVEKNAEFDGTKATFNFSGVTWTSTFNGDELNGVDIVFDGVKTVDILRSEFNAINYPDTVEHDGAGTEVIGASTQTLNGGSYLVMDKKLVYKDLDGIYKLAIADGTIKSRVAGISNIAGKILSTHGLHDINTGFDESAPLYLSGTIAGEFTILDTNVDVGLCLGEFIYFSGFGGDTSSDATQNFDAIVTDVSGLGQYPETQLAVDAVLSPARILVNKVEFLKQTITTGGKIIEFVFNRLDKGWHKFAGQVASFRIDFDAVPDNGTWRIEWNGQESIDLPFNANAATIEAEFNLFSGHLGATVTGDYSAGFVFTFLDEIAQPLPTFDHAGLNEIQKFNFGNIPDNGTVQFDFGGQTTINFPWDDDASDLKIALENLSTLVEVAVSGSFAGQFFQVEYDGIPYNQDGLQPKGELTVVASTLNLLGANTFINTIDPGVTLPISPVTIQQGRYKANNLRIGPVDIVLDITENTVGEPVGPDTAIILDAPNTRMSGFGLIKDFENGIDVNGQDGTVIALRFENVTNPILSGDKLPGIDADFSETLGFAKDIFSQLRITEHPTNKKRLKISAADVMLPSGIKMIQEIKSLVLDFDGAEIDFETGEIFKSDGATPLGQDFTPIIPAALQFRYASVAVIPELELADKRLKGQILVLFADNDGASTVLAEKAPFGKAGINLGQVALKGDLGLQEVSRLITVRDIFGSLDGTALVLEDDVGTVAFWSANNNGPTAEPPHGALRSVKLTTINDGDDPNTVASKYRDAINGDSKFSASVTTNRIIITDLSIGPRTDIDAGDTGFFADVQQQGRVTDPTGLVDITNAFVRQLGTGGGTGGGGDASQVLGRLLDRMSNGIWKWLTPSVFAVPEIDVGLVDAVNTDAVYSVVSSSFLFPNIGDKVTSIDLLEPDFLSEVEEGLSDIDEVEVILVYDNLNVDATPTVKVSRDSGNEYQAVSAGRLGNSDLVRAVHKFSPEATNQLIDAVGAAQSGLTNFDGALDLDRDYTLTNPSVITQVKPKITVVGNPVGYLSLKVVRDNGGVPSVDENDVVYETGNVDISLLATGILPFDVYIIESNEKLHYIFETDQVYKDEYTNSAGANKIQIDDDGVGIIFGIEGRELNLRVEITGSTVDANLLGYAVYYKKLGLVTPVDNIAKRQIESFDGEIDNENQFSLSWKPDARFLVAYDIQTGQAWGEGSWKLGGSIVTFESNFFKREGVVTLAFKEHNTGGSLDNSDTNFALIQENHLGSVDGTIDESFSGRGHLIRNSAGVLGEITYDENWTQIIKEP